MSEVASALIVDFGSTAPETTRSKPPGERLIAGNPEQIARNYFSDSTGRFSAGIWECTPGKWHVRYSENEFCYITRGRVRIEHESGRGWMFSAGSAFVIPAGFNGVFDVQEPTAKLYVIYEPA